MKLVVSPDIAQRFPELRVSIVVARGLANGPVTDALEAEVRAEEEALRARLGQGTDFENDPRILAWREVYRSFDVNPKKYRPSAEALIRRVAKGGSLPSINLATNAYLLPQLRFLLPVGGYDLNRVVGDVRLRFSPGGEQFVPIGASEPETTTVGEIVYADDEKVLTRRWNYKDCDQAKIAESSTDVALFIEAARPEVSTSDIVGLAEAVSRQLQKYCGGRITTRLFSVSERLEIGVDD